MKTKIWVYLLVICLVYLESINGSCERSNKHIYIYREQGNRIEIVCFYKNIASPIQAIYSPTVCYKIVILSSKIVNFSSTTIVTDGPIYYMQIQDSSLSTIEKGVFRFERCYLDLQEIHFPQNNLSKIESGVFKGLSYLSVLNLTQNQIETVEDNAFDSLDSLTSLDLSENRLKSISSRNFIGLSNLNTLLLNGNRIITLESDAFDGLKVLTQLYIDGPGFTNYASNIFEQSLHGKEMNLSKSKFEEIEARGVGLLKKMVFLDLHLNVTRLVGNSLGDSVMLRKLHLQGNQLTSIDSGAFKGLVNLRILNITDLSKIKLKTNTFAGLANVKELLLPKHGIIEIEEKAFYGLENLQMLDLSQQNLTKLVTNSFDGLRSLEVLYLNENKITIIESGAFNGLINLKKLNISSVKTNALPNVNELFLPIHSIIEEKAFNGLNSLQELDLSLQNFTKIVANTFIGLSSLKNLTLTKNAVDNIEAGAFNGTQLSYVDLSLNALSLIASNFTKDLQTIVAANFSFNSIKILEVDNFDDFKKLATLDLSHNIIDALPVGYFADLNSLQQLDISHNTITMLEVGTFVGLGNLNFLDLSHNKIATMPTIVFHNTPQLSSLDVSNNSITNLDPLKLKKFTKLRTIDIDNNFFDCKTLSGIIEQFWSLGVEIAYGTIRKLSGIHIVICDVDGNKMSADNKTSNLPTFNTGNETKLPEHLPKYLEANTQMLKEAMQEPSNTSNQMLDVIQLLKDEEEEITKVSRKESMHSQNLSQNHDNDLVKLSNLITTEIHQTAIIGVATILIVLCLFGILILLAAKCFRKVNVFKNRNFSTNNVEEQIML